MLDEKNIEIFSSREKIRNELIKLAEERLELSNIDFSKTSYLSYLIDILSIMNSNLMFYNSSVYKEFFLTKANKKESILNIANMLDYDPPTATASSALVLLQLPATYSRYPISMTLRGLSTTNENNNYFKVYTKDNIPFTLTNTIKINIDQVDTDGNLYYDIREFIETITEDGEIRQIGRVLPYSIVENKIRIFSEFKQVEKYTYDQRIPFLKPYEFYNFDIPLNVGFRYLESLDLNIKRFIEIPGEDEPEEEFEHWESYSTLRHIPTGVKGFTYRETNNGVRIYFGNGIIGTKPVENSDVEVEYFLTSGSNGNVITNTIKKSDRVEVDSGEGENFRRKPLTIECSNPSPSRGGEDPLDIEEIRSRTLANVSANNRIVSENDHINLKNIKEDLPIDKHIPILKRSDIKSKVDIYTDVIYNNNVVPLRSENLNVETIDSKNIPSRSVYTIDDIEYYTIFDIYLNTTLNTANYYYTAEKLNLPLHIETKDIEDDITKIYPKSAEFIYNFEDEETDESYFDVVLHYIYMEVAGTPEEDMLDLDELTAVMKPSWSTFDIRKHELNEHDFDPLVRNPGSRRNIFNFKGRVKTDNVPFGEQKIDFYIYDKDPSENTNYKILAHSYIFVTLRSNLDRFISSEVEEINQEEYKIYGVPLINKDYFDSVDKLEFTETVLNKIVNFNINDIKMINDDVGLNFSNTSGYSTNMKYNKNTKLFVDEYNPTSIPTLPTEYQLVVENFVNPNQDTAPSSFENKERYISKISIFNMNIPEWNITEDDVWNRNYIYEWNMDELKWDEIEPFYNKSVWVKDNMKNYYWTSDAWLEKYYKVAFDKIDNPWEYDDPSIMSFEHSLNTWDKETLRNNDIFYIHSLDEKRIFNGIRLVKPKFKIPVEIEIIVWIENNINEDVESFTKSIKDHLVEQYYESFGYNTTIFISNIIKRVCEIDGVKNCRVKKPLHDIFFDFDYKELTEKELVELTPEMIYFTTNNIRIIVEE